MYSITLFILSIIALLCAIFFTLFGVSNFVFTLWSAAINKEDFKFSLWNFLYPSIMWALYYLLNIIMWYE